MSAGWVPLTPEGWVPLTEFDDAYEEDERRDIYAPVSVRERHDGFELRGAFRRKVGEPNVGERVVRLPPQFRQPKEVSISFSYEQGGVVTTTTYTVDADGWILVPKETRWPSS